MRLVSRLAIPMAVVAGLGLAFGAGWMAHERAAIEACHQAKGQWLINSSFCTDRVYGEPE